MSKTFQVEKNFREQQPVTQNLVSALHESLDVLISQTKAHGGGESILDSLNGDDHRQFRLTLCDFTGSKHCEHCAGTGVEGAHE